MSTALASTTTPTPANKRNATRIDNRIRKAVNTIQGSFDSLCSLIDEARRNEIHHALGFKSWTDYLSDAVKLVPNGIEDRREVVSLLAGEGMSNRAIGEIVGADERTVRRDIESAGAASAAPETTGLDGKKYKKKPKPVAPQPEPEVEDDFIEGEVIDDGPSLPRPEFQHSTSLITDMREALDNLMIDLHELNLVVSDDRFSRVRNKMQQFESQLTDAAEQLSAVTVAIFQ